MKRPSPNVRIKGPVKWTGKHYVPLTKEELEERDALRRQIKAEGHLDAHAEYLRRLPVRRFE